MVRARRSWTSVLVTLLLVFSALPTATAENAGRLLKASFTAADADPSARLALGNQRAFVDLRVPSRDRLVVFLHGAGVAENCGPSAHLRTLASYGFHVFSPCYVSDYGVENCGDEIAACRLEAFDGDDRHPAIAIARADSIETRIGNGLRYLEKIEPGLGWIDFLAADGRPQWDAIVLTGHSHGASTAALIGKQHRLHRIVLLSGPYDVGQAWLDWPELTEARRYFGLTHSDDKQHAGHLAAFAALGVPGPTVDVDHALPPFAGSHQLITSVASDRPHSAVHAGKMAAVVDDRFVLDPTWRYLYGVDD